MGEEMEDMVVEGKREKEEAYIYYIPDGTWNQHFSSILLSSDVFATSVEVVQLSTNIQFNFNNLDVSPQVGGQKIECFNYWEPCRQQDSKNY